MTVNRRHRDKSVSDEHKMIEYYNSFKKEFSQKTKSRSNKKTEEST